MHWYRFLTEYKYLRSQDTNTYISRYRNTFIVLGILNSLVMCIHNDCYRRRGIGTSTQPWYRCIPGLQLQCWTIQTPGFKPVTLLYMHHHMLSFCSEGDGSSRCVWRVGASRQDAGQSTVQNHCSHQFNLRIHADVEWHSGRGRSAWRCAAASDGGRCRLCFQRSNPAGESSELKGVCVFFLFKFHDSLSSF